jgi:hypothetical protein
MRRDGERQDAEYELTNLAFDGDCRAKLDNSLDEGHTLVQRDWRRSGTRLRANV